MPITSVRFRNFKALRDYSISLHHMNVLVGAQQQWEVDHSQCLPSP